MNRQHRMPPPRVVTLTQMLAARERRARRQQQALQCFGNTLICGTLIAPGGIKDSAAYRRLSHYAREAVTALCREKQWPVCWHQRWLHATGPEFMLVVEAAATEVKTALIALEARHPLGRLWDLDVLNAAGEAISRTQLGIPPRCCLICAEPAHLCARARRHALWLIKEEIHHRMEQYERNNLTAPDAVTGTTGAADGGGVVAGGDADAETGVGG